MIKLLLSLGLLCILTWPPKLEKKIHKVVEDSYKVDNYNLNPISVDKKDCDACKVEINDHLFSVTNEEGQQGYIYVGIANSMKNTFDYVIAFDKEFKIINTKILIYREQHGRQIGSKRWLSQFFDKTPSSRVQLGENIDGISGATISATNMTDAVNDVLITLDHLKTKDAKF